MSDRIATVLENPGKSWQISRPWKDLEFGLLSFGNPGMGKIFKMSCLSWQDTIPLMQQLMFENKTEARFFPRRKSCKTLCWINIQNHKAFNIVHVLFRTEGPWICSKRSWFKHPYSSVSILQVFVFKCFRSHATPTTLCGKSLILQTLPNTDESTPDWQEIRVFTEISYQSLSLFNLQQLSEAVGKVFHITNPQLLDSK